MSNYLMGKYDVIVIGAGHAGCEAGLASARLGKKTLMLSINLEAVAMMACNPSIGGTGKGHLVREIGPSPCRRVARSHPVRIHTCCRAQ